MTLPELPPEPDYGLTEWKVVVVGKADYFTLRTCCEAYLRALHEACTYLDHFKEMIPYDVEYLNASEWRCGAQDMAGSIAKAALGVREAIGPLPPFPKETK